MACGVIDGLGKNGRWSLRGMTALVTGGSKGIGYAVVEDLAELGASVHTCARNEAELMACVSGWRAKGLKVTGSVCDVASKAEREKLLNEVFSLFDGKLNILINNVGGSIYRPTIEYTTEDFSYIIGLNLESAFHVSQLAYPLLKAAGGGSIIQISSVAGVVAGNSGSIYAASKAGMNQLTKQLACEWGKDNIRTNCVAPWMIRTPLSEPYFSDEKFAKSAVEKTPLRRTGEPKELSCLVTFLCLPIASFINGQVISVDGGMTANGFFFDNPQVKD